jgi:hypothetical protein
MYAHFDAWSEPGLAAAPSSGPVFDSPSLQTRKVGESAAFELKFVLDEAVARALERALSNHLRPDPHAAASAGVYRTQTLYSDTPELDVFHGRGTAGRSKFRVRRYESAREIFLERKTKRGDQVRKRRDVVTAEQLCWLAVNETLADWAGNWFRDRLVRRRLQPVCRVDYERLAYFGEGERGPVRLTFDRQIRGVHLAAWTFDGAATETGLLCPGVICEFKFRGALPGVFRNALRQFSLVPTRFSKYRHCVEALGMGCREKFDQCLNG